MLRRRGCCLYSCRSSDHHRPRIKAKKTNSSIDWLLTELWSGAGFSFEKKIKKKGISVRGSISKGKREKARGRTDPDQTDAATCGFSV